MPALVHWFGKHEIENRVHIGHLHGGAVQKEPGPDGLERIGTGSRLDQLIRLQPVEDGLAADDVLEHLGITVGRLVSNVQLSLPFHSPISESRKQLQ